MPQIGYAHRPVALGRSGMVASAHPLATLAGVETLKGGGTVVDAAVAVNAVLAVTQPNMCGVGGDLFALYHEAASRRVHFLDGAGRSGARASLDELRRRGLDRLPVIGPPTVSVPGCVRAWGMLLERFGTRPLAELLAPAIRCADGFPLSSLLSQGIDEYRAVTPDPEWHRVFAPGGRVPVTGELFAQPDLADAADRRQRRPKLVGHVGREAPHLVERLLEPAERFVEHRGQPPHLVAGLHRDANGQVAGPRGHLADAPAQHVRRVQDAAGGVPGDETAEA